IEIFLSFQNERNQYRLSLRPTDDDNLFPASETAYFWDKARYPGRPYEIDLMPRGGGREAGISHQEVGQTAGGTARWVRDRLSRWRLYHMHDTSSNSPMRKTAKINDNAFLRPDGANLPAFLYLLGERHPDSYRLIRRTVQRVAPFFDDFQLRPDPLN